MTETIHIQLTVDEVNLVVQALAQLPYHQVYNLIGKIHQQSAPQISEQSRSNPDYPPSLPPK